MRFLRFYSNTAKYAEVSSAFILVPEVRDSLKRLSISVDPATHVRLKVLAAEQGTTMNAIVEAAVKEHLFKSIDMAPDSAAEEAS